MIASGLRIGRYEVGDRLGKGSFGVVHLARDVELGRDVALKVLKPEFLGKPTVVQRFLKEARAAATIDHPGIVTVFECGQIANTGTRADGNAYIAMELLRGESLTHRMEREGRLPPEMVIAIGRQLASALAAAHAAGIIHRDLKPDNVFLIPDSAVHGGFRVKLLDFGMAKLAELDGAPITHSKMILGTPRYMSPEQARSSAKIDQRTDIYALGCILYELACGHPPFSGDAGEVIVQHQTSPPARPSSLITVPAALDTLIVQMLAKVPDDRPRSMAEVETALAAATTADLEPPTGVFPPKPPPPIVEELSTISEVATTMRTRSRLRDRWPLITALALAGLLLGGLVAFVALRGPKRKLAAPVEPPVAVAPAPDAAVTVAEAPRTVAENDANRVRGECQALLDANQLSQLRECADRLQPLDPDAATAFRQRTNSTTAALKRVECKQLYLDKKWQDAIDCAAQLEQLKDPEAAKIRTDADSEAKAEATQRRLADAANNDALRQARKELDQIPVGSVYRKQAEKLYADAEKSMLMTLVSRALQARARDKSCRADYADVLEDAVKQGLEAQVRERVKCVQNGAVASAAPPPPPAVCDAAALRQSGESKMQSGLDAAALVDFEASIKCRADPETYIKAFMAACRSRHEPKARQYYKALPTDRRDSISQICVRNGITF
jgi:protein kinase-like protein